MLASWLCFVFVSCDSKKRPSQEFQIYFTADVNGRLEPCGCFTGQYGGMTRIDTWLHYEDPGVQSLRLDAGDALKGTADFDLIHYRHVLSAFAKLQFHALNLGAREAALSASQLESLASDTRARLVSANVVEATSGELFFPAFRMIDSQNQKVAVIGLLDPDSAEASLGEGLEVQPMEVTLSNLLPALHKDHRPDLTVLLAFTNEEKMRSLAKRFYELDIILGGDVPQPSQEMIIENESIILFTTNEARAVGDLHFSIDKDRISSPKFDIHLMEDGIPQSADLLALSKAYRELIRSTKLEIDTPGASDQSRIPGVGSGHDFVGSAACFSCHPASAKKWRESAHSRAFASLLHGGTDADPNCISCHTIGFGEISGYRRAFGKDKLTDVGCESCHGPGSEHVRQRSLGDPAQVAFHYRTLGASDCTKCHHGEFSRPFKWEEFWPKIIHGKEEPSPNP